jgi:hypothetical protein
MGIRNTRRSLKCGSGNEWRRPEIPVNFEMWFWK